MIELQRTQLTHLKDNSSGNYIYFVWSNNFGDMDCFGHSMEYENAYALGKSLERYFNTQVQYILDASDKKGFPKPLDDPEQKCTPNSIVATIRFDANGDVLSIIFDE